MRQRDGGLAADRVVRAVVQHDVTQVAGPARADDRERAHVHEQRAVAVETIDLPRGLMRRRARARSARHGPCRRRRESRARGSRRGARDARTARARSCRSSRRRGPRHRARRRRPRSPLRAGAPAPAPTRAPPRWGAKVPLRDDERGRPAPAARCSTPRTSRRRPSSVRRRSRTGCPSRRAASSVTRALPQMLRLVRRPRLARASRSAAAWEWRRRRGRRATAAG